MRSALAVLGWLAATSATSSTSSTISSAPSFEQRQRFVLDILVQVQRPLLQPQLIDRGGRLLDQAALYTQPHDSGLLEFWHRARTGALLGRMDIFDALHADHQRQLRALYKFLALARDWHTFEANLAYARLRLNPILLVNGLMLAAPDRADCRDLLWPALSEIVPQMFFDAATIAAAYNAEWTHLVPPHAAAATTTPKRSLLEVLGLGLWGAWRRHRMQASTIRPPPLSADPAAEADERIIELADRLVVPVGELQSRTPQLADDVGLNEFWNAVVVTRLLDMDEGGSCTEARAEGPRAEGPMVLITGGRGQGSSGAEPEGVAGPAQDPARYLYRIDRVSHVAKGPVGVRSRLDQVLQEPEGREHTRPSTELEPNDDERIIDGDRLMGTRTNSIDDIKRILEWNIRPRRSTAPQAGSINSTLAVSGRRGEIFVQTLRQLLARLRLDSIALQADLVEAGVGRRAQPQLVTTNGMLYQGRTLGEAQCQEAIGRAIEGLRAHIEGRASGQDVLQVIGDLLMSDNGGRGNAWDALYKQMVREAYGWGNGDCAKATLLSMGAGNLREPLYLDIVHALVDLVDAYKQRHLPAYASEDVVFPMVSITDLQVDRFNTYVEPHETDLINVVDQLLLQSQANNILRLRKRLVAQQMRLNHRPFTLTYRIAAQQAVEVVVRTFLGPKLDGGIGNSSQHFILLDSFGGTLKAGSNVVVRHSQDIPDTSKDVLAFSEIYRSLFGGHLGQEGWEWREGREGNAGTAGRFPHRLLLPRGTRKGLPVQVFVVVTPRSDQAQHCLPQHPIGLGVSSTALDDRPPGFPLDRKLDFVPSNELPNMLLKDALIMHDAEMRPSRL